MGNVINMSGGGRIKLVSIAVTTPPNKTAYRVGEYFDPSGMVVHATYSNGTTMIATGYSFEPDGPLSLDTTSITIRYSEGGISATTSQAITCTKLNLPIPSQTGTLVYTGEEQSPQWNNYNSQEMEINGINFAINAGNYQAVFSLINIESAQWEDGTITDKTVTWNIQKAIGVLSISRNSITLDTSNTSKIITVTHNGTGAITAQSSSPDVASTSVNGEYVTVNGIANGSAIITVSVSADSNYTTPQAETCSVQVQFLSENFANNEWSEIIAACQSGNVPASWVPGSYKNMIINGTEYRIDIIGKNHDTYATGGTAPLTFQMHDAYDEQGKMNDSSTTTGGWEACDMRNLELPQILSLMPSEIKDAIRLVQKKSGAGRMSSDITITNDKLFLLAEIEVFGEANESVQGEGIQYDYYAAGNSPKKEKDGKLINWWLRSPERLSTQRFIMANVNGIAVTYSASSSLYTSFAFCF